MSLMTKELEKRFEAQGYTGDKEAKDIIVIAKFFNPIGVGTWFCYEYEQEDRIFWCFANLGDPDFAELGTVSLDEMESLNLPFGLKIERDLYFTECSLQEVIDKKGEI